MSKTDQDKSYFLAFCIEQYKVAKGMDGADVARLFFENGVASYLSDNFEVLHTQSRQWLIEEIDDMLDSEEKLLRMTSDLDNTNTGTKPLEVNQQNLHLFLPGKIANVAAIIADKTHCTVAEAMQRFYASKTYQQLQQENTKLWHLGAVGLYELYCEA